MKRCRHCDNAIRRKPTSRGMESPSQTRARKFCGRHCWREWKRDHATASHPAKLYVIEMAAKARRRFAADDAIWYTRALAESYGWPVRVPARFVEYTHDFGRSRVVIRVRTTAGRETRVVTQDWKLSPRVESDARLLGSLPEFDIPLRLCELCEAPIPQVSPGGKVLPRVIYEQRRFCRNACANTARRGKVA